MEYAEQYERAISPSVKYAADHLYDLRDAHEAFHRSIHAAPATDPLPSLVYADWLDENDRSHIADVIRGHFSGAASSAGSYHLGPWSSSSFHWNDIDVPNVSATLLGNHFPEGLDGGFRPADRAAIKLLVPQPDGFRDVYRSNYRGLWHPYVHEMSVAKAKEWVAKLEEKHTREHFLARLNNPQYFVQPPV